MEFPVADPIERSISSTVNSMVGTNDVNLNTIVKIAMMDEIRPLGNDRIRYVIDQMRANNEYEANCIKQEYGLTLDTSGNVVTLCIDGPVDESKEGEYFECQLPESK